MQWSFIVGGVILAILLMFFICVLEDMTVVAGLRLNGYYELPWGERIVGHVEKKEWPKP